MARLAWTELDTVEVGQDNDAKVPGRVVALEALQQSWSKSSVGLCAEQLPSDLSATMNRYRSFVKLNLSDSKRRS